MSEGLDQNEKLRNLIARREKHQEIHIGRGWYSIQRMDLLTISISGASIYYCLEHSGLAIVLALFAFVLAIVANFISQMTGKEANENEAQWAHQDIKRLEDRDDYDADKQTNADCNVRIYNKATKILNRLSVFFMFIGLVLLIIHYLSSC